MAIVDLLRREDPEAEIAFVTSGRHDAHLSGYDGVTMVDASAPADPAAAVAAQLKAPADRRRRTVRQLGSRLLRFLLLAAAARAVGAEVRIVASSAADARLHRRNEVLCRAILSLTSSISVRDRKSMRLFERLQGADASASFPTWRCPWICETEANASQFRPPGLADDEPYIVIAPRNFLADQPYLRTHFAGSFDQAEALGCSSLVGS